MTHAAHFEPYDILFVRISRAPIEKLIAYDARMGSELPWVSSYNNTYNQHFSCTLEADEVPGVSVYVRDDEKISA